MTDACALDASDPAKASVAESSAAVIERAYTDGKIRLLGIFLPIGILLLVAFAFWDYAVSAEAAGTTIPIRGLLCLVLLGVWMARSSAFVRRWHDWVVCGLVAAAGITIAGVLALIPDGFSMAAGGIALVIMFGAGAVRMRATQTVLASVMIIGATAAFMLLNSEPLTMVLSVTSMLASFGLLGLFYNVASRRDALGLLTSQARLVTEKEQSETLLRQITTMRQERLTWLENLARFLRHELKNQIVAVGTSIDLAQTGDSLAANQIYLDRAQRSLNRMRGLVSSATEATSLEAALAADEMDAVDLSALVADRVLAFQQLHPSRQLLLSLKPGLFIHGNEERLAQLLDKLLNNAVEHSAPDAEIRVAFRRTENHWIELNVENECDPLPEDKERIFEAFVSSQRRPENLGLGLFVAQSIACNHGGRIFAEDLPGGRGARFVVRLPEAAKETSAAEVKASRVERIHRPARDEDQPPQ